MPNAECRMPNDECRMSNATSVSSALSVRMPPISGAVTRGKTVARSGAQVYTGGIQIREEESCADSSVSYLPLRLS
jgi:hypothetical protein